MTRRRISVITFIFMLAIAYASGGVVQVHAAGTDEIKNYAIDILPQDDGSLVNTYAINWCVISNSAGPLTWITVGMPNEQYEIMSSSGDVASVKPYNEGFNYQVRIDLPREVNAGDCVNFTVQVHQYGLAYLDETTNEIGFQFTPGWFNDVPVDHLQVTWHLPSDPNQMKSISPKPTTQNDSQAVWESDLQPGEKFPISVVYDKAAFPNFSSEKTGFPTPTYASPTESGFSPAVSTPNGYTGAPVSPGSNIIQPLSLSSCICNCLILILILIVLLMVFGFIGSAARSYRGGGFFGGYSGGGGWSGGGGGGSGSGGWGGASVPRRTGGGSGLFGGRGMSCACVSRGCACACAGGGRAGCSRKGFDVSSLFQDRLEKNNP
jgi:hypothetical protein